MFCGHMIGAVTGICITKLMELLPEEQFLQFRWLAGSTSCATTLVLMQMTNNRHPPACSTAILVAIDNNLRTLSWSFIPIILLTATVSLCITLFINNIQRRYPAFWLYPGDLDEPAPIVAEEDDPTTRVNSIVDLPKTIQDKRAVWFRSLAKLTLDGHDRRVAALIVDRKLRGDVHPFQRFPSTLQARFADINAIVNSGPFLDFPSRQFHSCYHIGGVTALIGRDGRRKP
ncbi:HPP family-domain-containing protein [Salix suchowensis]|nr:HPP family-domain-containing protein [Salix suchowensis]